MLFTTECFPHCSKLTAKIFQVTFNLLFRKRYWNRYSHMERIFGDVPRHRLQNLFKLSSRRRLERWLMHLGTFPALLFMKTLEYRSSMELSSIAFPTIDTEYRSQQSSYYGPLQPASCNEKTQKPMASRYGWLTPGEPSLDGFLIRDIMASYITFTYYCL